MTPTVWIANFAGHDYSEAESWGKLRFLTKGYVPLDKPDRILYTVTEELEAASEDDWFLPAGILFLNILIMSVLWSKFDRVNLLVHKGKVYEEVKLHRDHNSFLLKYINVDGNGDDALGHEDSPDREGRRRVV